MKKEESIFELAKTIAELGVKPAIVQKFIYDTKIETAKEIIEWMERRIEDSKDVEVLSKLSVPTGIISEHDISYLKDRFMVKQK